MSVFNQCTRWRCVCSYFMHLECSWQRATGTLTTQEWKASRSVWLGLSRVRERGCLACTESSPHLHTHTHTHTHTHWSYQYNPSCTFTTKHFLEHGYTHSLKANNFPSASPWVMNTLTYSVTTRTQQRGGDILTHFTCEEVSQSLQRLFMYNTCSICHMSSFLGNIWHMTYDICHMSYIPKKRRNCICFLIHFKHPLKPK